MAGLLNLQASEQNWRKQVSAAVGLGLVPVTFYGAQGIPGTDDSPAFAASDAAGEGYVGFGTWYITNDLTLSADWVFAKGAQISITSGKVVTFNGNVSGYSTTNMFTGAGTVVLAGQREPVYAEWWGAKADNSTPSSAAIQAAHDALTHGGVIFGLTGIYSVTSAMTISKCVHYWGAARGINPTSGGTTLAVGSTIAHNGTVLFNFTTGSLCWRDFQILAATTDPTQNYTAIKFSNGAGKMDFRNIEVLGSGVGWDLVAGNVGDFYNCSSYYFSIAGVRFGGTASVFSGPWRFYGGIVNNPNVTDVTNGATVAGNAVIHMASTASVATGMGFAAPNIPVGTKVLSKTSTTVTLDHNATGAGVASGDRVRFGYMLDAICLHFKANAFDISFDGTEVAGGQFCTLIEYNPTGAGLLRPNSLWFQTFNATAATHGILYITGGVNIRFSANSWLADAPFGAAVFASAGTSVAADLEGLHFSDTLIGGGGTYGAYFDYCTNFFFSNTVVVGNSLLAANTYNGIHFTANPRGQFSFMGGAASNDNIDSVVGQAAYGILLTAGSFGGAGDSVNFRAKVSGQTAGYLDNSAPAGTLKQFNPLY